MDFQDTHFEGTSKIIVEKNKLIGAENETFQNLIQKSIDKGSKNILVDLSNVEYVSSWGIGILVHAYTTCRKRDINFRIENVKGNVMNVLNQLKLTEFLDIN